MFHKLICQCHIHRPPEVQGPLKAHGPDPAPRGAYRGRAPKQKLCTPKRGLCPEKINRLGATGVNIEAQVGVYHRNFRNFCGLSPDFMTFWDEDLFFFWRSPVFGRKNRLNSRFRPENPFESLVFTLFI